MSETVASEIWGELKRYVNTVDRDEAAEAVVALLLLLLLLFSLALALALALALGLGSVTGLYSIDGLCVVLSVVCLGVVD